MDDLIVSLDEFAELVGVSSETMRAHLKTVEGSPTWLVERGDRGRAYKILARGGMAWWAAKRDADIAASAERRAEMAQLRLEIVGDRVEGPDQLQMSGRQRREEYEAAFKALEYRRRMGALVERSEIEHVLTAAAVELRRRLLLVPGEFRILSGLALEDVKPLEQLLGRAVDGFLAAIGPIAKHAD